MAPRKKEILWKAWHKIVLWRYITLCILGHDWNCCLSPFESLVLHDYHKKILESAYLNILILKKTYHFPPPWIYLYTNCLYSWLDKDDCSKASNHPYKWTSTTTTIGFRVIATTLDTWEKKRWRGSLPHHQHEQRIRVFRSMCRFQVWKVVSFIKYSTVET